MWEEAAERTSERAQPLVYIVKSEREAPSALSAKQGVGRLEVTLTFEHARAMMR